MNEKKEKGRLLKEKKEKEKEERVKLGKRKKDDALGNTSLLC